jgi:adenosylcobinamide-GDP ribazoletransferase
MTHELRLFFIALQFMTRVPVPRWVGFEPDWLNASARHFPAVGIVVGLVGAGVLWASCRVFPQPVAAVLSMTATVLLTGAFHEDGLADTCDGLGGAVSRERALEIMKDSRIGSYGAVGLWLVLALKATALATLPLAVALVALLFAHAGSRAAPVALIRWLAYAGDVSQAKAKPLSQRVSTAGLVVAIAWVLALAGVLFIWRWGWWLPLLASVLVVAVATWVIARWLMCRLGGITGDTLGATQQVTELLVLLTWLAWVRLA